MSGGRRDVRLTTEQVATVLRRAAEIEAEVERAEGRNGPDEALDAAAVEAAAEEVGLSPAAVRQAVAELQVGTLIPPAGTRAGVTRAQGALPSLRRTTAPSHVVSEQRIVAAAPATALAILDGQLSRQMFAARRRSPDSAVFRPRDDLLAKVRRALDVVGHLRLDGVAGITIAATPCADGTLVRVEAEMLATRSSIVGGSAATGAATTLVTGVGGALLHEPMFVLAAFPAGAAVAAGGIRVRGRRWDEQRRDVNDALTLLLDRI
jgi:hypothetical protein